MEKLLGQSSAHKDTIFYASEIYFFNHLIFFKTATQLEIFSY